MHCASLLRTIFAIFRGVHLQTSRDFFPAKRVSKIYAGFLLNEHGDLYFYYIILMYKLFFLTWKIKEINRKEKRYS